VTEGGENCIDEARKISGIGEIISDEGEARVKGRIRCYAFGDRRIDRSVTDDQDLAASARSHCPGRSHPFRPRRPQTQASKVDQA